ncbi:MAG: hypothetical protein QM642_06285 [Edaphocola sp.]
MKRIKLLQHGVWICLMTISLLQTSCKKDEETFSLTQDQAAALIQNSLKSETYGLVALVKEASGLAADKGVYSTSPGISCGIDYSDNYSAHDSTGINLYYRYNVNRNYGIVCSGTQPDTFDYALSAKGRNFNDLGSGTDTINLAWKMGQLVGSGSYALLVGTFERRGEQMLQSVGDQYFSTYINFSMANSVDKTSHTLVDGTIYVTFTATYNTTNYQYEGTITVADGNAVLKIDDTEYAFVLE